MPLAFITIGIILILTGIKGDAVKLGKLVVADFKGQNGNKGYAYWMIAILVLGAVGYIKGFQPVSRAFMILVVVVLLLHNQGFFKSLQDQVLTSPSGPAGGAGGSF